MRQYHQKKDTHNDQAYRIYQMQVSKARSNGEIPDLNESCPLGFLPTRSRFPTGTSTDKYRPQTASFTVVNIE